MLSHATVKHEWGLPRLTETAPEGQNQMSITDPLRPTEAHIQPLVAFLSHIQGIPLPSISLPRGFVRGYESDTTLSISAWEFEATSWGDVFTYATASDRAYIKFTDYDEEYNDGYNGDPARNRHIYYGSDACQLAILFLTCLVRAEILGEETEEEPLPEHDEFGKFGDK